MTQKDPIGQLIRNTRRARRISVPQLADILNIPKDRIYKWETGSTPKYEDRQVVEKWLNDPNWKKVQGQKKAAEMPVISPQNEDVGSIRDLSKATLILAENNKALVWFIVYGQRENHPVRASTNLSEINAEIETGKRKADVDDILKKIEAILTVHTKDRQ